MKNGEKHLVTVTWSPTRTEGLHTMGCGLVPQGDRYDIAITNPVPCSLQHDTLHLGLGKPEPVS
jgi:hypothetical protein